MSEINNLNWFPGHMAKTRRMIENTLVKCDAVAEIVDARIPLSSQNPYLAPLIASRPKILIINKADLADSAVTERFVKRFEQQGIHPLITDCRTKKGVNAFLPLVASVLSDKTKRLEARNLGKTTLRVMVVGIPNCGKSTFINALSGKASAKAEDRPGVTRDVQIVHLPSGIDIYDMPGILMPKISDSLTALKLAATGAVGEKAFDSVELAAKFAVFLNNNRPSALKTRYGNADFGETGYSVLEAIARRRGFLIKGGEADLERTAAVFLDEFRAGLLGRITLDD